MRNHKSKDQGIGLYTRQQLGNTTPFQYFAQIVVGAVVLLCGAFIFIAVLGDRSREAAQFGNPESHSGGFVSAIILALIGVFIAHAGVIFWSRILRMQTKKRRHGDAAPK